MEQCGVSKQACTFSRRLQLQTSVEGVNHLRWKMVAFHARQLTPNVSPSDVTQCQVQASQPLSVSGGRGTERENSSYRLPGERDTLIDTLSDHRNVDTRSCPCGGWHLPGFPRSHSVPAIAISIVESSRVKGPDDCSPSFSFRSWNTRHFRRHNNWTKLGLTSWCHCARGHCLVERGRDGTTTQAGLFDVRLGCGTRLLLDSLLNR